MHMEEPRYTYLDAIRRFIIDVVEKFFSLFEKIDNILFFDFSDNIVFLAPASVIERGLFFNGNSPDLAEVLASFAFERFDIILPFTQIETLECALLPIPFFHCKDRDANGARDIYLAFTHALLTKDAFARLDELVELSQGLGRTPIAAVA